MAYNGGEKDGGRLSCCAEMLAERPWERQALDRLFEASGVGVGVGWGSVGGAGGGCGGGKRGE